MRKFPEIRTISGCARAVLLVAVVAGVFVIGREAPSGDLASLHIIEVSSADKSSAPVGLGTANIPFNAQRLPLIPLTNSTDKLQDLFKRIGYELDGVRKRGEVPRVFILRLPSDLQKVREVAKRKVTFIKFTLPLILYANELILQDRKRLLALETQAARGGLVSGVNKSWLATMLKLYGLKHLDYEALLERVDIIPPSLAIAQAAEESGWGTSRFATEGNALFGQRIYQQNKEGMIPFNRTAGKTFKVRSFDQLIDGVKAYVHNLNSHFAYNEFRAQRAVLRKVKGHIDGHTLAGALTRYSERGEEYINSIRLIMHANSLQFFDSAKLDKSHVVKPFGPNA